PMFGGGTFARTLQTGLTTNLPTCNHRPFTHIVCVVARILLRNCGTRTAEAANKRLLCSSDNEVNRRSKDNFEETASQWQSIESVSGVWVHAATPANFTPRRTTAAFSRPPGGDQDRSLRGHCGDFERFARLSSSGRRGVGDRVGRP